MIIIFGFFVLPFSRKSTK